MDVGPCAPWPIEQFCCDTACVSPAVTGMAVRAATEVLWARSGRRFDECEVTLLPCREECGREWLFRDQWMPWENAWPYPALVGGLWYNLGCGGGCGGGCSCNDESTFTLPAPVTAIVNIMIDGEVVPSGSYALFNERRVVRLDGGQWPLCNDGSWTATVRYGNAVPQLGRMAAAELACAFVKACSGEECGLPLNVKRVIRQNVQQEFFDVRELLKEGKIGLYLSDLFITTFNPSNLADRPSVHSPDAPRPRRRTVW